MVVDRGFALHVHRTIIKNSLAPIRIQRLHVATLQGQRRDEAQHIARLLQGGELPVGSVATAAHGPGDEGTSRHGWPEDDGGESLTSIKTFSADCVQRVWQCDGGETTALPECTRANTVKVIGECQGGETTALPERTVTNSV